MAHILNNIKPLLCLLDPGNLRWVEGTPPI